MAEVRLTRRHTHHTNFIQSVTKAEEGERQGGWEDENESKREIESKRDSVDLLLCLCDFCSLSFAHTHLPSCPRARLLTHPIYPHSPYTFTHGRTRCCGT
jgi:hypothetical protein